MVDTDTIKLCIQACINSYNGEYGEVKDVFEEVVNFKVSHTEGYYAKKDGKLYIVFQGSRGKKDWKDNLKFWRKFIKKIKPYGNIRTDIKIHSGFLKQYKTVRFFIHELIRDCPEIHEIIVTGHSLGGALATLCAVDLQYNFSPEKFITCVSFGSPRVGNRAFVRSYDKRVPRTHRIVNGADIVCSVPLVIMGFVHVSTKISVKEKKWYWPISINDHYPNLYQNNCEKKWPE